MQQIMTAKLKLMTTPEQHQLLRQTQLAYRDALNYVSHYAFAQGKLSNAERLQKGTYPEIRALFHLPAQMACNVPRQVASTYKGLWTKLKQNLAHRKVGHTKKRYKGLDKPPRYVSPTLTYNYGYDYSFKSGQQVSVLTLHGRIILPYQGHDRHVTLMQEGATHYARLQKRLQKKGTRSATRRRIALGGRERWLKLHVNHHIAKHIVATHPHALIGLKVDPDYTSQTCPVCGYTSKQNRPKKGLLFICQNTQCPHRQQRTGGQPYTLHADLIGARNIAMRTLLTRQDWVGTGVLSVRPDVSDAETKAARLKRFKEHLEGQVAQVVKEIVSGVNDSRPKLLALLKDRLTRFGFRYLETLVELQGRTIEIVNVSENDEEDLTADLVAIVSSFTARLYGQRRAKRATARTVQEWRGESKHEAR